MTEKQIDRQTNRYLSIHPSIYQSINLSIYIQTIHSTINLSIYPYPRGADDGGVPLGEHDVVGVGQAQTDAGVSAGGLELNR